jgi:hypothetical protein
MKPRPVNYVKSQGGSWVGEGHSKVLGDEVMFENFCRFEADWNSAITLHIGKTNIHI